MTFAARALAFYKQLELTACLPAGVALLNPYADAATMALVEKFLFTFFDDEKQRTLVLGINPGRFGGGSTGIGFTDPVALEEACGIENDLAKRRELSSEFVYRFVARWGGPRKFFGAFYLSALCPFGFTRAGNNFNFYDDPALLTAVRLTQLVLVPSLAQPRERGGVAPALRKAVAAKAERVRPAPQSQIAEVRLGAQVPRTAN